MLSSGFSRPEGTMGVEKFLRTMGRRSLNERSIKNGKGKRRNG
ncbi:hypothetical protein [Azospirillum largimobile]